MTPERKKELDVQYAKSVLGKSQEDTQHEWLKYLTVLYREDNNYQVFLDIRAAARNAAAKVITKYIEGSLTDKELYVGIREEGQDRYARDLNKYGFTDIDLSSNEYKTFTSEMAIEVLQACKVWKSTEKDICVVRSTVWHRFVERLHGMYGLPSVLSIKEAIGWSSGDEKTVIDSNDFETKMTATEKEQWVSKVATERVSDGST